MPMAPSPSTELRAASLFDVDPELGELLDADHLAEARVRAIVAVSDLPSGSWSPAALGTVASRPFAILVVDGLLIRDLLLAGSTATELLGPCDMLDVGLPTDALLPAEVRWSVPASARIAVLDDRLLAIVRQWPAVARVLLARAARHGARLSTHRAIAQLPRVDQRLVAFFGYLAERWGRVGSAGMVIPLQLTHETLGRLIGARRPTVSLALKELAAGGVLERRNDGAWLLSYEALDALSDAQDPAEPWQPADARRVAAHPQRPTASARVTRALQVEDVAALLARVAALRDRHAEAVNRSAAMLERSREIREALGADDHHRHGAGAWPPSGARPGEL